METELRLKKISNIIESNLSSNTTSTKPQHQVLLFLKHFQGWWLHMPTRQFIPMPNQFFSEKILADGQTEPPLVKLKAISSSPVPA